MIRISANEAYLKQNDFALYAIILVGFLAFSISSFGQTTYYVNGTIGNDNNDGLSWGTALASLQAAIDKTSNNAGDQIWVAADTYYPSQTPGGNTTADSSRYFTFYFNQDIQIYGGFTGAETMLTQRNLKNNTTILSGNIGERDTNSDNVYHVLYTENVGQTFLLDGFTIRDGNANNRQSEVGSGGGGLFNLALEDGVISSPTIRNCIFTNNDAANGAAVFNFTGLGTGSPHFINVLFFNNTGTEGGAVLNICLGETGIARPLFLHTTFYKNTSMNNSVGGGIASYSENNQSQVIIYNSIFWNNGISIYNEAGTVRLVRSLVEESNCGSLNSNGSTNIECTSVIYNQSPHFVDTTNANFQLQATSPAIDTGIDFVKDTATLIGITIDSIPTDIIGNPRKFGEFDMGAYEYQIPIRYYVNANTGSDSNTGLSWKNSLKTLQAAIDSTRNNVVDQIWVANGTYFPTIDNPVSTDNTPRDVTFYINKNIALYGGFAGTETTLTERNPSVNVTTLSGDIGITNDSSDNAYHVVFLDGTTGNGVITNACIIDGFSIEKGTADGSIANHSGGGIYNKGNGTGNICSPIISHCLFSRNTAKNNGGAIFNESNNGTSSPTISYCNFSGNTAASGGAINNQGTNGGNSNPTINNCNFSGNTATNGGGAIYTQGEDGNSNPTINNCTFSGNTATNSGGAIFFAGFGNIKAQLSNCLFQNNGKDHIGYVDGATNQQPHFRNCTFTGATSFTINMVYWGDGQTPIDFTNCIFWGNNNDIIGGSAGANDRVNIQYSIVEESAFAPDNNNISQDPLFVDAGNGDFYQQITSPAMNAGTTIAGITTDLDGQPRPFNGQFDMGAYEIQLGPDADTDGVIDSLDLCNGGNDRMNSDGVGMPDDCDCNPTSAADDIMAINGIIPQDTVKSSFTITSEGTVNSGVTSVFQAGHSITLKTGFTANAGSNFTARIDYCRTPPAQLTEEELTTIARTNYEETKVLTTEKTLAVKKVNNIDNANELTTIDWWTGPNPFRQTFTIQATITKDAESVSVLVYDQTGRLTNVILFETPLTAGTHEWQVDGASIPLGMAYVILQVGTERLVKKVIRVD